MNGHNVIMSLLVLIFLVWFSRFFEWLCWMFCLDFLSGLVLFVAVPTWILQWVIVSLYYYHNHQRFIYFCALAHIQQSDASKANLAAADSGTAQLISKTSHSPGTCSSIPSCPKSGPKNDYLFNRMLVKAGDHCIFSLYHFHTFLYNPLNPKP